MKIGMKKIIYGCGLSILMAMGGCQTIEKFDTRISEIQGEGFTSPLENQWVTTQGQITKDFRGEEQLNGFFIQDAKGDANPRTSDGIFVRSNASIRVGETLILKAKVIEYKGETQLDSVEIISQTHSGNPLEPMRITFPMGKMQKESLEGMLVNSQQQWTITDHYNLDKYGQFTASVNGRTMSPTELVPPGKEAIALAEKNNNASLLFDDGSSKKPNPIPHLNKEKTLRNGSTFEQVTGIFHESFFKYCIETNEAIAINYEKRQATAPTLDGANIKIASFNVLNYFNGDGKNDGFPTSRGAKTYKEFERQRRKIILAIAAMDAGIVGLMEMENDGNGKHSAIQDLVNGLNTYLGKEKYQFIPYPTGKNGNTGSDVITTAFIYDKTKVSPSGKAYAYNDGIFNRPPIAQEFKSKADGKKLIVVVNHFKSKGCRNAKNTANEDQGDGQGCYNSKRIAQAEALLSFTKTLKTTYKNDRMILIGDFNAYSMEDPIQKIINGGFQQLTSGTYSYVYKGMFGSLDHAFVSPALQADVLKAVKWHINADEPRSLGYQEKNPKSLYQANAFRSSDHDPVLIGIK